MSNQTERRYYTDSYETSFRANVTEFGDEGRRLVLDRTAFYPSSGGQPHDTGTINGVALEDVIDEGDRIVHVLASPVSASEVEGVIDWPRRFDHMQQHTGQHLLSAVFTDLFGIDTISFHLGSESSTIDLACNSITSDQLRAAESRVNSIIYENRTVVVSYEDASAVTGLRKASERSGSLRVVSIEGLDRSACGGTHVRATGEIGVILLRSTEKIRGNIRLDFLCGARAVRRARADYDSLESSARLFSAPLDELPALVAAQAERLRAADKIRKCLEGELAEFRGRELYVRAAPNAAGLRVHSRILRGAALPDDIRSEAMAFIGGEKSLFIVVSDSPASVLLASSADSGVHSGNSLKAILAEFSGKGGGAATMAQGSFAGDPESLLGRVLEQLAGK